MTTKDEYGHKLFVVRVTTPVVISEQGVVLSLDITDYEFDNREDATGCIQALHNTPVGNFKTSGTSILDVPKSTAVPLNFKIEQSLRLDVSDLTPEQVKTLLGHIDGKDGVIKLSELSAHLSYQETRHG